VPCEWWLLGIQILEKNAKSFWNQCKILSVIQQIHRLTTKIPTDLDEVPCQFIRQMLFAMRQSWWVQRYGIFVSMHNFTLQKGDGCLDSIVEKAIMKMQKKTQRHTRGLAAQFINFLHALEYQHINYTLEWYLLCCFYPRIGTFSQNVLKTLWEIIFKTFLPWYENSILFFKTSSEKFFVKLHWQTRHVFNKFLKIMWKLDKQMKIELHIRKC